ncbi:MAG: DUF898 domain-containing protein [Rhodanobacter sp.]|jgi:uncharacterized membrane protein YjgN (DUF898 family)|nr:DUF898 domain-containing protein [Rhodanobacter sp.]
MNSSDVIDIPAPTPWPPPPQVDVATTPAPAVEHCFEFHGNAREYFRIWIVNLALGIVTLGIYSAWAKVRTEKYFYGNTRVADAAFDYHAPPLNILKGRIIAFMLFGSYTLAGHLRLSMQFWLALLIVVLMPWLIVRGAAFRARYSSWRGIHFRFVPDYAAAYINYLLMYLLVAITLGILGPYVKAKQRAFIVEHHRYGGKWFTFHAGPGKFYPPYLTALGAGIALIVFTIVGVIAAIGVAGSLGDAPADHQQPVWLVFGMMACMYSGGFVILAYLTAALVNLVWNHIQIDGHRFSSTQKGHHLLWIYFSNTLAILASVGLLIPWAMIRLARYRAEHLVLVQRGDLDHFVAEAGQDVSAFGAEVDSFFDIDIGI